ncbi:MFS transporter [Micrococcoides hystricis]|uniref:MFS transporter n=1 Tax=Micrococcoides hystricis TaxID=1572761 RepID=A0ABV6P9Y7_9MICC
MQRERLWTKNFILTALVNVMVFFNAHLLLSTLAIFAITRFAVGDAAGGASASIFVIGALVIRPLAGQLMARLPIKTLLLGCLAVFVVTPVLLGWSPSYPVLLIERFVHGLAFGVGSTITSAVAVAGLPVTRLAEGTSWYATSTMLGVALGPVAGLALINAFQFQAVIIAASVTSAFALVLALIVNTDAAKPKPPSAGNNEHWITKFISPEAVPAALVGMIASAGYASIVTYLGLFADERQIAGASIFFLVYGASVLASRPFTGPLMDRKGFSIVMVPALGLFALSLVLLSAATNFGMLLAAALGVGLGYGNMLSAGQTIAVTSVPKHRIGMATATFFLGIDAGIGLGPILLGPVVLQFGTGGMYFFMGMVVAVLTLVYIWVSRGQQRTPRG